MVRLKVLLPYAIITVFFFLFLAFFHPQIFKYKFNPGLIHDYLRSQDIEDPKGLIHDRITISDSDIYIASGYLYAEGTDPTVYNFQHPPLIKYLFGFSTLLTGNPFWIQMIFGLFLLWLTYFLGTKLFKKSWVPYLAAGFLLVDPVFGGMMDNAFLDLGQAVFSLGYLITVFFFPGSYVLEGLLLGLSAASKFWSTTIILLVLTYFYRIFLKKEKMDIRKTAVTLGISALTFALTYSISFYKAGGVFNIFEFLARDLKFMLSHNSANYIGGPFILFITGYFAPWWQTGVARASDWFLLWPVALIASTWMGLMSKIKDVKWYFYLLPIIYLILTSTQVPFTRYFILILPYVYLGLAEFLAFI